MSPFLQELQRGMGIAQQFTQLDEQLRRRQHQEDIRTGLGAEALEDIDTATLGGMEAYQARAGLKETKLRLDEIQRQHRTRDNVDSLINQWGSALDVSDPIEMYDMTSLRNKPPDIPVEDYLQASMLFGQFIKHETGLLNQLNQMRMGESIEQHEQFKRDLHEVRAMFDRGDLVTGKAMLRGIVNDTSNPFFIDYNEDGTATLYRDNPADDEAPEVVKANVEVDTVLQELKRLDAMTNYYVRQLAEEDAARYNAASTQEPVTMFTEDGNLVKMFHLKRPFSAQPDEVIVRLPNGQTPKDDAGNPITFNNIIEAESYLRRIRLNLFDEQGQAVNVQKMEHARQRNMREHMRWMQEMEEAGQKRGLSFSESRQVIEEVIPALQTMLDIPFISGDVPSNLAQSYYNFVDAGIPPGRVSGVMLELYQNLDRHAQQLEGVDLDDEEAISALTTPGPFWTGLLKWRKRQDRGVGETRAEYISKQMNTISKKWAAGEETGVPILDRASVDPETGEVTGLTLEEDDFDPREVLDALGVGEETPIPVTAPEPKPEPEEESPGLLGRAKDAVVDVARRVEDVGLAEAGVPEEEREEARAEAARRRERALQQVVPGITSVRDFLASSGVELTRQMENIGTLILTALTIYPSEPIRITREQAVKKAKDFQTWSKNRYKDGSRVSIQDAMEQYVKEEGR